MTKIIYKKADLFSGNELYLAHGCNCQGYMGKGVALQVKKKYPKAYKEYRALTSYELGKIQIVRTETKIILNCLTQQNFGYSAQYCDYDAIRSCFRIINEIEFKDNRVAMPKIGSSLGGGDWNIISIIIEEESSNFQPIVYEKD